MKEGMATQRQIDCAKGMLKTLGHDEKDYDFENMTCGQAIHLLGSLREDIEVMDEPDAVEVER